GWFLILARARLTRRSGRLVGRLNGHKGVSSQRTKARRVAMSEIVFDELLIKRLPLPLAQLYRRAHNAKTALERHQAAFYLWEAALKLLGAVAITEYAEQPEHDAQVAELLTKLARPAVGHWWEFVRSLVPVLAERQPERFERIRELLLGRT